MTLAKKSGRKGGSAAILFNRIESHGGIVISKKDTTQWF